MTTELPDAEVAGLCPKWAEQADLVYCGMHEAITAGDIPVGTYLTSADLAVAYRVHPRAVAAALRGLAREGLTASIRRRTRVVGPPVQAGPDPATDERVIRMERVIRVRLANGTYAPGQLLPEKADLAEEFSVPQGVIGAAMDPLFTAGYLAHSLIPIGTKVTHRVLDDPARVIAGLNTP